MRWTLTALALLAGIVQLSAGRWGGDDPPPPILVPDLVWVAEGGLHADTQPAQVFDGISQVLKVIPGGVLPAKVDQWTVAKVDASNEALQATVMGHSLRLRLKIHEIKKGAETYDVVGDAISDEIYATEITAGFVIKDVLAVARLQIEDDVIMEGKVNTIGFVYNGKYPQPALTVTLEKSRVVKGAKP